MTNTLLQADAKERISAIKKGLPFHMFEDLAAELQISAAEFARIIGVAPRTLQRRKQEGQFAVDESDRLFRILRLVERSQEVLGPDGTDWLTTPKRFFGGQTPLDVADTEVGAWEVTQALGRLEHGVFL